MKKAIIILAIGIVAWAALYLYSKKKAAAAEETGHDNGIADNKPVLPSDVDLKIQPNYNKNIIFKKPD